MSVSSPSKFGIEEGDLLSLEDYCRRLERFLEVDKNFVEGSLVTCLDARFGCGKSTFIKMWKNDLLDRIEGGTSAKIPIVLNAWDNDFCDNPLVSIISDLQAGLCAYPTFFKSDVKNNLVDSINGILSCGVALTSNYIATKTGINLLGGAKDSEALIQSFEEAVPQYLVDFNSQREKLIECKESLAEALAGLHKLTDYEEDGGLLIFVDELDRCRPDYAIKYLETIKHIFDIKD